MKKSHLQQTSVEVAVGALIFVVLLALGFFTIILSRDNIFTKSYVLDVVFADVSGLIKGDKVYVHGVDVGRVKDMKIVEKGVMATLSLRDKLDLHENYVISVLPSSILGGKYIGVEAGTEDQPLVPEGTVLKGTPPVDFIGEATEAVKKVRDALEEGGILENLSQTMGNLKSITADLEQGKGTLGKLLKDEEVYNELKSVAANLRDITGKINEGQGTIGKLVSDEKVYNDLQQITGNLRELSDRLQQGKGTIGKLLSEDDTLYQDLSSAATSLKDITGTISRGEGTLGKLAKDEALYSELSKLLAEIRAAVDDIRETTPVASFSSVFFGAF